MIASLWRKWIRSRTAKPRTILNLERAEDRITPAGLIAIGSQPGTPALVTVYDADTKAQQYSISPFPGFTGGVNVAMGDVNGDGVQDIIVGAGSGGAPLVNIYNGSNGSLLKSLVAGDLTSRAGASVAAGDIDQDGLADIVTGAIQNGQPLLQVFKFSDLSVIRTLRPFTNAASITVATGDVNGDGTPDIIAGSGANVASAVAVFSGSDSSVLRSFTPFETTFLGGVFVAGGDVNGDGRADVIVSASTLGGPRISIFSGLNGVVTANFFSYDSSLRDGTFAVAYNADNTANLDIATTNGPNNPPDPKAFNSGSLAPISATLLPGLPITTAYDSAAPSVILTTSSSNPTGGTTIPFTATFSEAVNGFSVSGLTITNGTAGAITRVNARTYTFSITPNNDGAVSVTVAANAAFDAAGNRSTASAAVSVTYDGTPPTVSANAATTNDTTPTLTGTVSESTATVSVAVGSQTLTATVSGTSWSVTVPTTLAEGSYTITATATDTLGNSATATANLVIDLTSPIPTVSSTASATTAVSPIPFRITFDEDVSGFVQSDLTLVNGTVASFTPVSPRIYDVTITPNSNGDVSVSVLAGRANDTAGNPNVASNTLTITFDNTAPTVTGITATPSTGAFGEGATIDLAVTFSEEATLSGGTLTLLLDTGATVDLTQDSGNPALYVGTYTVGSGENSADLNSVSLSLSNGATLQGNGGNDADLGIPTGASLAANASIVIDTIAPSVTVSSSTTSPTATAPVSFRITFSEDVTGFTQSNVTIGNGTISSFTPVSGSVYDVTITPDANGPVTVSVLAGEVSDAAGNANLASNTFSITFDDTAPTVTGVTASPSSGTFGVGASIDLTVTFSEEVTLSGGTLTLLLDTGAVVDLAQDSGNPAQYIGTYVVGTGEESLDLDSISLTLSNGATLQGNLGNDTDLAIPSAASLANNAALVIDSVAPTATVSTSASSPTSTSPIPFRITFSEDVVGFTQSNVTVGNGTVASFTAVSGTIYDLTITPDTSAAVTVSVNAGEVSDVAGNPNVASNTASVVFDDTMPTVTGITANPSTGAFNEASTIDLTVTFSEPVTLTGGTLTLLLDTGATVDLTQDSGNPALYVGTYTVGSGENSLDLSSVSLTLSIGATLQDEAGNDADLTIAPAANLAANADVVIDTIAPTPSVSALTASPAATAPIAFRITFDEDVVGFTQSNLSIGNGTVDSFTAVSGTTYDVTIAPQSNGTVTVTVLAGEVNDAAGNPNVASNTASVEFDDTASTVLSITASPSSGTFGETAMIELTVTFSEAVTLSGGTLSLLLDTGASVDLTQDSGNPALYVGTYTVASGENSLDLDSVSLTLSGGATLQDEAGNDADLTISVAASLASNADLVIDTTP